VKPLLIACDFDGTITRRDTLHVIVEEYGEHGMWDELTPLLQAGVITLEEAMSREFACVRAAADQVRALVAERCPIRPGFVEMVDWAADEGHRLVVLSNGFRSVIGPVLADAGLGGLDVVANDARFGADGCVIEWADRGPRCERCDRPCKRAPLRERWRGETLVYLGDGISDRCTCLLADVIFARDGLAEHLSATGVAYTPFEDFHDVVRRLETPAEVHR
jgi:2-hydroxy-3-keto-5-methylthiopentenyl-1-phosphate phosphatase